MLPHSALSADLISEVNINSRTDGDMLGTGLGDSSMEKALLFEKQLYNYNSN